ncbi:MAG TPA: D-aminoacyl-tRNA deacylase, partial [Polyangiales bacterium]
MRAVVQRVAEARVEVDGAVVGQIGLGLLVYLGAGRNDGPEVVPGMAQKLETL